MTSINEVKTLVKDISCWCKCKFDLMEQHISWIKNGIMISVNLSVKSIVHPKKIIVVILVYVFVKIKPI